MATRTEKAALVDELAEQLKAAPICIVSGFKDVSVADQQVLRSRMRDVNAKLRVVKNSLASRAATDAGMAELGSLLTGQSAFTFGSDDVPAAARVLHEFSSEHPTIDIRGAMLDELRTMDWVPRLVRSKASKLNEAIKQLEARLGRAPNENELAEQMGLSTQELEKLISDANAVGLISLNKKWYETDSYKDVREIDILEDKKGEDPTRRIQKSDLMRLVTKGLNRNERLIIILYYYEELTMKEIGATLDLSESRVSQMHSAIVQRLQGQLGRRRPEFGNAG